MKKYSEWWKMTGNEDNVGFLATGSGVEKFQLSLRGWFVFMCRRFFRQPTLTKNTTKLRASERGQTGDWNLCAPNKRRREVLALRIYGLPLYGSDPLLGL
jgi:hypothetical protein